MAEGTKDLPIRISPEVHREMRFVAADLHVPLKALAEAAIRCYLTELKAAKKSA